ncbi:Sphingomyelin phosphodiesterase [Leptospira interrogans serovar Canicola]|nr:Sphingomyelin phosphodiesterase [Leptospira interrogans serovar Canicola]
MWSEEQKKIGNASLGNFRSYSLVNGGVVILSKWPIEEKNSIYL